MLKKTIHYHNTANVYADDKLRYFVKVTGELPDRHILSDIQKAISDPEWTRCDPCSPMEAAIEYTLLHWTKFNTDSVQQMIPAVVGTYTKPTSK